MDYIPQPTPRLLRNALCSLSCAAALAFAACDDTGSINTACDPREDYAANETVCCESYGIGSDGGYCCYDFEWTLAYDCDVGTGTEGGGRQIVVDSCCEDR